jgi:ABC-type spermidine/putrescine transport system permease subunit II
MKNKSSIFGLLVLIAMVLGIAALLLPLAPGVAQTFTGSDGTTGVSTQIAYDFILGNKTAAATRSGGNGAFIASFVLLIVAVVFFALALLFSFSASKKFAGFLSIVAGLCALIAGVLFIFVKQIAGLDSTYTVLWGFYATAIAGGLAGLLGIGAGVIGFKAK